MEHGTATLTHQRVEEFVPGNRNSVRQELEAIEALITADDAKDYRAVMQRMLSAREKFHYLLAESLCEAFNANVALMPQKTLAEKQALTRRANLDLRMLGLAIRCPKTGEPAMLLADQGYDSETGRFQLRLVQGAQQHRVTVSSRLLPRLDLMEAPLRREALAETWQQRVSKRASAKRTP